MAQAIFFRRTRVCLASSGLHFCGVCRCRPPRTSSIKSSCRLPVRADSDQLNNANDDRVLTLRGQVSSFSLKQVAQELIRRLDGAEEVKNHLEVVAPPCTS